MNKHFVVVVVVIVVVAVVVLYSFHQPLPFPPRHDNCFFKWYNTEFMEGNAKEAGCEPEWKAYQECIKVRRKKVVGGRQKEKKKRKVKHFEKSSRKKDSSKLERKKKRE